MKRLGLLPILSLLLQLHVAVLTTGSTFSAIPEDLNTTVGRTATVSCAAPDAVFVTFLINGGYINKSTSVEEGISCNVISSVNATLNVEARVPNTKTIVVCRAIFDDSTPDPIPATQQCNDMALCVDSDPAMLTTKFGVRDVTCCNSSNETGQLCITCRFGELEGTNISGCAGDIVATSKAARNFTFEILHGRGSVDSTSTCRCIEVDVREQYCVLVYDLHIDGSRSDELAAKKNISLDPEKTGENSNLLPLISLIIIPVIALAISACVICYCWYKKKTQEEAKTI